MPSETPAALRTERFGGPYRAVRRIEAGASGRVFEALDETTDERVAVKELATILDFEIARDEGPTRMDVSRGPAR
ncbi:MAG: hypothetical protein AB7S26_25120 [Sandaracinaceae bacterium]